MLDLMSIIATGVVIVIGLFLAVPAAAAWKKTDQIEKEVIGALGITVAPSKTPSEQTRAHAAFEALSRPSSDCPEAQRSGQEACAEACAILAKAATHQADGHARLIVKYYAQGHQQAFATFVASVVFGVAGFGVVIAACVYLLTHPDQSEPAGIAGAVGLATQAVSFLFFRRADAARSLMLQLIDKLRDDRKNETRFIAGLLAGEGIGSATLRDAVRAATALQYSNSTLTPEQLNEISSITGPPGRTSRRPAPGSTR